MFKKCISLMIVVAMLAIVCPNALAVEADHTPSVEEILNQYHEKVFEEITASEIDVAVMNTWQASTSTQTLEQETVNELVQTGYEAYNVTSSNYSEMENTLQTDLASMGIDPGGSYIVVVSGDNFGCFENASIESWGYGVQSAATAGEGSSFTYTLDGKTYTMRYVTVTAANNSYYGQVSSYRIVGDNSPNIGMIILQNILNTGIIAALDYVSGDLNLGTIASICGLELVDFGTSVTAFEILDMYAATNWTRIFTQIWIESESRWVSQLHVEYVRTSSYLSGYYYDAGTNSYKPVPQDVSVQMAYSQHLDDRTWRIEQAIYGFRNDKVYYDLTGKVKYKYGNNVVITHYENF